MLKFKPPAGEDSGPEIVTMSEVAYYPECGVVYLVGAISDNLTPQFFDIVMSAGKDIKYIVIQSEGGDAYAGFGLGDIIAGLNVTTIGIGQIFSMGAYMFALGKKRWCLPNTSFLIHAGSAFGGGPTPYSQAQNFQDFWGKSLVTQYLEVTLGHMKAVQRRQMRKDIMAGKEFWFDSKEAKRLGFIDKVIGFDELIKVLKLPCVGKKDKSEDDED